ncbi:MAG: putative regulator PrlF [Firmicutes bacterium ADurb.Bin080]|nr:MAG: putative regulator PrlF [Firmicutes bacterium ADurb.Bin080]
MELARISSKGQITIPKEVRKKLNLKEGDKVLFVEENGKVVIANASYMAFKEIQQAMQGEAERQGISSEEDVNKLIKEVRREMWEGKHEDND